ncbi:MAG: hypothetical protein KF864_12805 [Phycisphaeraceae bacterium]|nr:hypothetical protein [Phycisphaeraceae bacterium]
MTARSLKLFCMAGAVAAGALCASTASAGFVFQTSRHFVMTPRSGGFFDVGDLFFTDGLAGFLSYVPDTADDPNINPADLPYYKYSFFGEVVATGNNSVVYGGFYSIVIDLLPYGIPDFDVSYGQFAIVADFNQPGRAVLSGVLNQLEGPSDPSIFDLSYGGNPITYSGIYIETDPGVGGQIEGIFRQDAIPSPGSALTLGGLLCMSLFRRRR